MAKISELKKVQLLEESVLKNDLESVQSLFDEYKSFEFTARALGIAGRYSGADMVSALVKNGARFEYENTSVLARKYNCNIKISNNFSQRKLYEEWILPAQEVEEVQGEMIPQKERSRVFKVLSDYQTGDLEAVLLLAIKSNDLVSVTQLNDLGVTLKKKYSDNLSYLREDEMFSELLDSGDKKVLLSVLTTYLKNVPIDQIKISNSDVVHFIWGKGKVSILDRYCSVELFDFFARSTNLLEKAKKWDVLSNLVKENNAAGIAYVLNNVWNLNKKETDELLSLAKEKAGSNPELLGYVLSYKEKTFGKSEVTIADTLTISEATLSPAEIKKQWGYKKQDDGTIIITSYKGNATEVHIPGMIGKGVVTAIDKNAFSTKAPRITPAQKKTREQISFLEIPGTVKEIPDRLFCKESEFDIFSGKDIKEESMLTTVIINEGTEIIGEKAFANCKNIQEVVIPDTVNEIRETAFSGCELLSQIRIPASVHILPNKIFEDTGFVEFQMPDTIDKCGYSVFGKCKKLEKVTISKAISSISSSMFRDCSALKTLEIPENIIEIESSSFSRSGLEKCIIPDSVKKIGRSAFFDCKSLRTVKIPEEIQLAEDCFQGCDNLSFGDDPGNNGDFIVIQGVLQSYKGATFREYCIESAALPPSVKKISESLWEKLPDIIYHPLEKEEAETAVIEKVSVGDGIVFGRFPQTEECTLLPLTWKVLSVEAGSALLITSKSIISVDGSAFYNDMGTWDNSKIRNWLNTEFIRVAFTDSEQRLIKAVKNTTPQNPFTKQTGGEDTEDNVFLLSMDEVEKYMPNSEDRLTEITEYAKTHHPERNMKFKDQIYWETRTNGGKDKMGALAIYHTGEGYCNGAHYGYYTLRPAVWVRIEAEKEK